MDHLKGLVAEVGEEFNCVTTSDINPYDCSSYLELVNFLGVEDFLEKNIFDPYSRTWTKKQKSTQDVEL